MQRFILRRLAQSVLLLFVLALVIFALARVSGNPADLLLREDATQEDRAHLLRALGLDRPIHEQLYLFLSGAVRGDLGDSIRYRKPATEVFFERLPNTLQLLPLAMVGALVVAIPLGVLAAVYRGTLIDRLSGAVAVIGIATPSFWLGIVLIYVFSIKLGWLPSSRMGGPSHYVLPAITLGLFLVAGMMRLRALEPARGDGQRVREARPAQGALADRRDLEALPAQRADPRHHLVRRLLRAA